MKAYLRAIIIVVPLIITSFSISPMNELAIANDNDTLSLLWSRFDGHNATMWSVRWSPDNSMISSAFFDNTTVIWNSTTGERIVKLGSHENYTRDPRTRCDGITNCQIPTHVPTRITAWTPDGKYLLTGGDETNIYIFETKNWTPVRILKDHEGSVLTMEFSSDGKYLASGSGTDKVSMHNVPENLIKIWDFENGFTIANLTGHKDSVLEIKWSPDGSKLVSASDDKTLKIWDTYTWMNIKNFSGHAGGVLSVDWSPDGEKLVTGSRDYKIRLWNSTTGESLNVWQAPNCVRSVDWHANGEIIATSGVAEVYVMIRNSTTGSIIQTLDDNRDSTGPVGGIPSSRWSPDGNMLATASGKDFAIRVYAWGIAGPSSVSAIPSWLLGLVVFLIVIVVACWLTTITIFKQSKIAERR
ncbi:MAG: hypothetical protein AM326_07565 [Candidatus Thorarchaeota archaeon SMTZ-45]|nr:MAG: hypothetical protein AM326_07565 [Candidatus Thorarchaeota archaeon SMTZ-45]